MTNTKTVVEKVAADSVMVVVEEDINECASAHTSTVGTMDGVHTVVPSARENTTVVFTQLHQPTLNMEVLQTVPG